MPVTSSSRAANLKTEAKNNVTTDFYDLNLHSASLSGNLGLVGFALTRGQPVNSLLDGLLPLHSASSGGSDVVVRTLIDHGADVNAPSINPPKLPRKHSNDKVPSVVTAGSTPLHFAAANGHKNVVSTLLARGAHASRADKNGITAEMLARQRGWVECADVLRDWASKAELLNKDSGLRTRDSRDDLARFDSGDTLSALAATEGEPIRKRIQIKNSLDRSFGGARNMMLKVSSSALHDAYKHHTSASTSTPPTTRDTPSPFGKPLGEYTFYPTSTPSPSRSEFGDIDPSTRRPSLPHIHMPPPQRPRASSGNGVPSRPRSAGTGAELQQRPQLPPPSPTCSPRNLPKKLTSKYSLLGLFKKGQQDSPERAPHQPLSSLGNTPPTAEPLPLSSGSPNAVENSSPLARPSTRSRKGTDSSLRPSAVDLHNSLAQQRDRSGSNASAVSRMSEDAVYAEFDTSPKRPGSPSTRMGILRSGRHIRDRSGSRSSNPGSGTYNTNRSGTVFDDDMVVPGMASQARPGMSILKAHNRSASSGQNSSPPSSSNSGFQALRFHAATASNDSGSGPLKGNALGLRGCNSVGSFVRFQGEDNEEENPMIPSASSLAPNFTVKEPRESTADSGELVKEEDDEEYGKPVAESSLHLNVHLDSRPTTRSRGSSFASSASSLSPVIDGEQVDTLQISEFPFSIKEPPPEPSDALLAPPARIYADNRLRGDSLSSTSTTDSVNLLLSTSGTTSGSGSITVMTPGLSPAANSVLGLSPKQPKNIQLLDDDGDEDVASGTNTRRLHDRRAQAPLDINIRSISSHAQAEALVQQTQRSILNPSHSDEPYTANSITSGEGWTPLSAKLAAYGESLALERRLREEKGRLEDRTIAESPLTSTSPTCSRGEVFVREAGVESAPNRRTGPLDRQHSLDQRPTSSKTKRTYKQPKRPNTSSGTPSHELSSSHVLAEHEIKAHHQVTRSASAAVHLGGPSQPGSATPQGTAFPDDDSDCDHPIVRSHTPIDFETESIIADVDGRGAGVPLYRTVTAPSDTPSPRNKQPRQMTSANKLTRMGFSGDPAPRSSTTKPRFVALKSLMQTFKGKA